MKSNFYIILHSPSTAALLVYITLFADIYARGIRKFCYSVDEKATLVFFPFFLNSSYMAMLFVLGIFLLFINVPFIHSAIDYEIPRMGRKPWLVGQTLYMLLACMGYVFASEIITNALLIPRISPKIEWGRIFTTLARTSAGSEFGMGLKIDYEIMVKFGAMQAVVIHYFITCGVCFLFAYLLFTLNLWTSKSIAAAITGVCILFPILTEILNLNEKYIWSPISWMQLSRIDNKMTNTVPSIKFIFSILFFACLIMFLLNLFRIGRFEWKKEKEI